jgi:hypothetical protein
MKTGLHRILVMSLLVCVVWVVNALDDIEADLIERVNEAREAKGVPILYLNVQLMDAAKAHSQDMASVNQLTHIGTNGSQFWERAELEGYTMTNGAENVLLRFDLDTEEAFEQWRDSPPHFTNIMNPQYQEVGVGYAQATNGTYYFTMVFGTRVGFATPTPSPTPAITLTSVTSQTNPNIILPSATPLVANNAATALPSVTPDPLIATIIAPFPTNTLSPIIPTITPNPFATPTLVLPTPQNPPSIRLFVSAERITVQNISGQALDLSSVVFESDSGRLEATRWDNGFLSKPLTSFPNGDCLDVWGLNVNQPYPKNDSCWLRHGWIAVNDQASFWVNTNRFSVSYAGSIVGYCAVTTTLSTCDVSFSASVSQPNNAQSTSNNLSEGVVRLLMSASTVTLLNLTGRNMDFSAWRFESNSASFDASDWALAELSRPLSNFPSGDCLQVWGNETNILPKDASCRFRHGWVAVSENRQFWRDGSFTVSDGTSVLATCNVSQAICDVRP